jgi:hypothetical protein
MDTVAYYCGKLCTEMTNAELIAALSDTERARQRLEDELLQARLANISDLAGDARRKSQRWFW